MPKPELSVVIPTLNEAEALPPLLTDLAAQRGLSLEVIVADGGSVDETSSLAENFFSTGRLTGCCLAVKRGRGRQMNCGAATATSDWLLFLHADSRLTDNDQLRKALEYMQARRQQEGTDALAGHFPLRFDAPGGKGFGLYFYESKAALGRPGTIHGDQGMLLAKTYFERVGPFREDLPIMEDTSLAEDILRTGRWLLLPGKVTTSARRFLVEGLKARQTLNALMINFLFIGWLDFFSKAPDVYREQDRTRPLQLQPFLRLIAELLADLPWRQRWRLWLASGAFVRSQVWQLGLALDCRKVYREGSEANPDCREGCWLIRFDRWVEPMTNHCVGRVLTALLVRCWFSRQIRSKVEIQFGTNER